MWAFFLPLSSQQKKTSSRQQILNRTIFYRIALRHNLLSNGITGITFALTFKNRAKKIPFFVSLLRYICNQKIFTAFSLYLMMTIFLSKHFFTNVFFFSHPIKIKSSQLKRCVGMSHKKVDRSMQCVEIVFVFFFFF